jgi:hypothetical protein
MPPDLSALKIDSLESKTNLDVRTDESKETVSTTLKETMVRDMDGESDAEEIALDERRVAKTDLARGEVGSNSPSTLRRERSGGKVESENRRTKVDGTDNATSVDDVSEDDSTQQLPAKTRKTELDVDEVSETTSESELVGTAKETMTKLDIEGTAPVAEKKEKSATTETEVEEDSDVSRVPKLEAGPTTKARRSVDGVKTDTKLVEGSTTKSRGTARVAPKDSDPAETTTETLDDELVTAKKKDAGLQITATRLDESTTITKEDEELEASTGPALEKAEDESDDSEAAAPTLKKDRLLVNTSESEIATETSKLNEELAPATGSSVSSSSLNSTKPTATAALTLLNSTKKMEVSEGGVQSSSKSADEADISSEMESDLDEEDGPIQQEVEANSVGAPKTCDYSVGKWVPDTTRPIYSGNECKLWLAAPFSCRLNHHPDLSFEKYRWQPDGCDLPKWSGRAFLNRSAFSLPHLTFSFLFPLPMGGLMFSK